MTAGHRVAVARYQLAVEMSPIAEVARSLGLPLRILYIADCPCGGSLEINPRLGLFTCPVCRECGDALDLVRVTRFVSVGEALRYLENRAGIDGDEDGPLEGSTTP